jgi:quinoprotein glucose dehydrogenase
MNRLGNRLLIAALLALIPAAARAQTADNGQVWDTFNGQLSAQKYATADQITPDNVGKLTKAWEIHTGDFSTGE